MSTIDLTRARTTVLFLVGTAALIYALIPPIDPQYLGVAGGMLGLDPVIRSAK